MLLVGAATCAGKKIILIQLCFQLGNLIDCPRVILLNGLSQHFPIFVQQHNCRHHAANTNSF